MAHERHKVTTHLRQGVLGPPGGPPPEAFLAIPFRRRAQPIVDPHAAWYEFATALATG